MASRKFNNNIIPTIIPSEMITNYSTMLKDVANMINSQSPVYSTWIRVQVGITNPIFFDTTSQDIKENLISNLSFNKKGVGTVNSFTLNIQYDPFNYGQETTNKVEALDDIIARVLSFDMNEDLNRYRGYIQYGYNNYNGDEKLVSPKYKFMLTEANSNTNWETGVTTYTLGGVSELGIDCDFNTAIPAYEDKNLLEVITSLLYQYYGDPDNPPAHLLEGVTCIENEYKYTISIEEELYNSAPLINEPAIDKDSPWLYCKRLLQSYMSETDANSEEYEDFADLIEAHKPRYEMFVSDYADKGTIFVTYASPLKSEENLSLDYTFSWGIKGADEIVQEWKPEVDLRYYLIQKAQAIRIYNDTDHLDAETLYLASKALGRTFKNISTKASNKGTFLSKILGKITGWIANMANNVTLEGAQEYVKKRYEIETSVYEMYNAELTTIGIPADIPLATEIRIIPYLAESMSRTAGVYLVQGCVDNISTNGIFTSTMQLLRIRDLEGITSYKKKVQTDTTAKEETRKAHYEGNGWYSYDMSDSNLPSTGATKRNIKHKTTTEIVVENFKDFWNKQNS